MQKWHPKHIKKRVTRAYHRVGGSDVVKRREAATSFASKHGLVYFHTVKSGNETVPVIRGSTVSPDQVDSNFSIGTHAGYDMVMIERTSDMVFGNFEHSHHRWYVLEIDLKKARNAPYIFVGTKQQSKAYFAKVLTSHRGVAHLQLHGTEQPRFHSNYVIIGAPSDLPKLYELFDQEVITKMAAHAWPFAIEVEDDTLILSTLADKPSEQLMNKLLHYGLWFARQIDSKLV